MTTQSGSFDKKRLPVGNKTRIRLEPRAYAAREIRDRSATSERHELIEATDLVSGLLHGSSLGTVCGTEICTTVPESFDLRIRGVLPQPIPACDRHGQDVQL